MIGGEPANGRSLLTTELVQAHGRVYPGASIAVIPWDRVLAVYYECAGHIVGTNVPIPAGETDRDVRAQVSALMRDTVVFALTHLPPDTRVIMEAPLIDQRGEPVPFD